VGREQQPSDLLFEQLTKFELGVNPRVRRGTSPPCSSLLGRSDEMFEQTGKSAHGTNAKRRLHRAMSAFRGNRKTFARSEFFSV
jgi:hypothetical protein